MPSALLTAASALLSCALAASHISAQQPAAELRGLVRDTRGPVIGANVFVFGTLDGALTDSTGRFAIRTPRRATYVVAVQHDGHAVARITVSDSARDDLRITIGSRAPQPLHAVTVQAGRYAAADEPGAVLTPIEIVTIPGTAADVHRAIQTLPGVQQVDEGTGLFVRGGDYTETRVYLNDGLLLNPAQLQNPAGTFVGTLDPFLLDAIYFTAGGFGARYGDALSAVVALRTQARPRTPSVTLSSGLAATGADVALPGPHGTGIRLVANRSNLAPVLRLNGSTRQYFTAPHGADLTASAFWNYRPTAQITLFATQQDESLGVLNETPSVVDTFAVARRDRAAVLSWRDVFGRLSPDVVLSSSVVHNTQSFGSFDLGTPQRLDRASAAVAGALGEDVTIRGGVEASRLWSTVRGTIPASGADQARNARVNLFDDTRSPTRAAAFVEVDAHPTAATRVVAGLRADRSVVTTTSTTSTMTTTLDPRLSVAWRVAPLVTFTGAWGVYHQLPDPTLAVLEKGADLALRPMRATQAIAGAQIGESGATVRVEAYHKVYADLVQQTPDFVTIPGGTGRANGVDIIARAPPVAGLSSRIVYSRLDAVRTDPLTGVMARAPFDVTHSVTLVATQMLPSQVVLGAALRYASGRPFTPVVGAQRPNPRGPWVPIYGAPESIRLPASARLDLSANVLHLISGQSQLVGYVALTNVLARANVYTWRYSSDYATRYDVLGLFNRSIYFGGVLSFSKQ